jgi:hypothetical protein
MSGGYTRDLIFFWSLFLDQAKKSDPPEAAASAAYYKKKNKTQPWEDT